MKNINQKRLIAIVLTGFVLLTTGCGAKEGEVIKVVENDNKIIQVVEEENPIIRVEEADESIIQMEEYSEPVTASEKEGYIIDYFNKANATIDQFFNSEPVEKAKVKSKEVFVTLVDFMFYKGEIAGITYDELSEGTKAEIQRVMLTIDSKIETKIPGYKETIKDKSGKTLTYLGEKFEQSKTYLEDKIKNKITEEKYDEVKNELKEQGQDIKDTSKDIYEKGKEKVKKWYEGWK